MNVAQLLEGSAARHGAVDAWRFGEQRATYADLLGRVQRVSAGLHRSGLRPGDRVILLLPNCPELVEVLFACMWGGLVAVPLNWHLHPDEVAYIQNHCSAKAILCDQPTHAAAQRLLVVDQAPAVIDRSGEVGTAYADVAAPGERLALHEADPADPAWLFYTSGTTGRPKGATLSHRNLLTMTMAYLADVDPVGNGAVFAHAAPLTHGSGLYLMPSIARAATNVIATAPRFDGAEYLALIERHAATHAAFLAPTMLNRVVAAVESAAVDVSSLRSVVVGGAPLYVQDLARASAALGPIVTQIYGQGESPMTITVMRPDEAPTAARSGSCGRPFVGVRVATVDSAGRPTRPGEPGEVVVSGDVVMRGYWNDSAATGASIKDGRLWTGDVGYFDDEGYLYLTDRIKDVIITGGSNVYPREVEETLLHHPAVEAVTVVGAPDPEWGESVCAFVVPCAGADPTEPELREHCRAHIAAFKVPRRVVFVSALPTNAAGKVLKREVIARYFGDPAVSEAVST
ncbi:MAG TPA: AMP-binding protein [Micromonosporaceae bacterium]